MLKTLSAILVSLLLVNSISGQSNDLQDIIAQGVNLYDKGDMNGALEQYQRALNIDKKSPVANYEIASTYFALHEYKTAIKHCDVVIATKTKYASEAYIVKGSSLDMLGKAKEAVTTYKKGIQKFPDNYLLYYNLAYTSFKLEEFKAAETTLQRALKIESSHASSHLLLGHVMKAQGNRVKSVLALYNFLLLEPKGDRAKSAFALLNAELQQNVKRNDPHNTTITLPNLNESTEFQAAELALSMQEASKSLNENKNKTPQELFIESTKTFFSILGEMKKGNSDFWWDYYVNFFYSMTQENYDEAFCYYIAQTKNDETINSWLIENSKKLEDLLKWYHSFDRKF